jgi:protein phosphatase PTC1
VSIAEEMNPRFRSTMEDAFVVIDEFGDETTGYFGVYDGHGGRTVASFLKGRLHENAICVLNEKTHKSVEECMRTSFLMTDIECAKKGEAASGSTAVVCIVRNVGAKRYIYTANCGDARAVLCHDGMAVRLSKDHKANDPYEKNRIQKLGGFVMKDRVMGVLAVARSFGDYSLKKYVTCEPYTSTTKINSSSQFIIIACDGVWDVLSDDDACRIVLDHVAAASALPGASRPTKAAERELTAAHVLIKAALERGSTDNITVLVVFL